MNKNYLKIVSHCLLQLLIIVMLSFSVKSEPTNFLFSHGSSYFATLSDQGFNSESPRYVKKVGDFIAGIKYSMVAPPEAPKDENFDGVELDGGNWSSGTAPREINDWTFTFLKADGTENPSGGSVDVTNDSDGTALADDGSDKAAYLEAYVFGTAAVLKSTSREKFSFVSIWVEQGYYSGRDYRLVGYRDGSAVSGATQNFNAGDNGSGGTLVTVSGAAWKYLDEVRIFRQNSSEAISIYIDDIMVSAAVLPDTTPPTVTSVSSSQADGTYKPGDLINIQVDFREAVAVTGTPQLTLETGATDRTISYAYGSGTSTLIFSYIVQAGDRSADLDYTSANALMLNGGTIKDAAGNDAILILPTPGAPNSLGANSNIVVDSAPTITSATYDANMGIIAVKGTNFTATSGAINDVVANKFTLTGEGGATYTLTNTSNVEIGSATTFSLTLSATDRAEIGQMVNKNGIRSTGGTTYNLAGAAGFIADWAATADLTGNGITVSNVMAPTVTSSTYDASTGVLVVTGTNLKKLNGATNDIVANKFTLSGEGGSAYTLTNTANVEIASGTSFTLTLSATDKAGVNLILNKNGRLSTDISTYNLAAAENWAAGAAITIEDATGNEITVSNVAVPTITSATYDANTGTLRVNGTGLLKRSGLGNDIAANKFIFTGQGGSTYTLTNTADVEVASGTSFTLTLSATDKDATNLLLNKNGMGSLGGTTYNLAAEEDWARGADAAVAVADPTGNGITVSNALIAPSAPTIGTATAGDGQVAVTFTAPANNGGSAITTYTATASPGGAQTTGPSSPITLTGLTNGVSYTFTITATNGIGTSASSAASNSVTPKGNQTITFPNPGAQAFGTTPDLSSTASATSSLAVSFTSSTPGVCTITTGGDLTFVSAGSCTINADQAGNSTWNAATTVTQTFTVNAAVPGAPTIGTVTAGDTQASVAFTAPVFTGGAAITSYTVTSSPGGVTGTGSNSPITVTGLTNGTSYTFTVTATNLAGAGNASAASNSVTPSAPQTITFGNPGTQNFGTTPTLTATSSAGGGYPVSFTSSTPDVCTITVGGALTFVSVGSCTINADQAGDGSYLPASQVSRTFTVNRVVPGVPAIGTATAGDAQASVSFTAPAFTGGAAIVGYTVTSSPGGVTGTGVGSPIIVTGLTNGASYTFNVTATNSAGTSSASAASNAVVPNGAPTISGTPALSINQDVAYSFIPTAIDAVDDILTFGITNKPTWAAFDMATGALTGTPTNADVGVTNGIVISVSDGTLSASLPAFGLTVFNVNDAPIITGTPTTVVRRGESYKFEPSAEDIDGDQLTFSIVNKPNWASFNTETGVLSGTPLRNDEGLSTGIVIFVSDGAVSIALPAFNINVEPAPAITGITFDAARYVYDGTVQSLAIGGALPVGATVTYANNGQKEAGVYTVIASIHGGDHYSDLSLPAELTITKAIIQDITFTDARFVYDGTVQSLSIGGTLPDGASVTYTDNNRTDAGVQTVTANIDGGTNYENLSLTAELTITKAVITDLTFADVRFVYDGTVQSLSIGGTLPDGASVAYTNNNRTDAGVQTVTANIDGGTNYENVSLTAELTITKAELTDLTFTDARFVYDGKPKALAVAGNLPAGASISYADNSRTDAGTQTVTANIDGGTNHENLSLTAALTISKAELTDLTFTDARFIYDGKLKALALAGTLPAGASVSYVDNSRTDAGTQTVTANINGGVNYENLSLTAALTISKAELTDLTFTDARFVYDGKLKAIAIAGTLPAGASLSYTNNGQIDAGVFSVTANINGGNNYNSLSLTATLTITKAVATITADAVQTYSYDGSVKNVHASLNHAETTLSYSPQKGYTEDGRYSVLVSAVATSNYEAISETIILEITPTVITGLIFNDANVVYDGKVHALEVTGLPLEARVTYAGNDKMEAGEYAVTATITQAHYQDVVLKATLTITKAKAKITSAAVQSHDYDGTIKNVVATLDHGETSLVYSPQQGYMNGGVYKITVAAGETANYLAASQEVQLIINQVDLSGVVFRGKTVSYTGQPHILEVENLPKGWQISYLGNGQTDAGNYVVTARINHPGYPEKILTASLIITKAPQKISFQEIGTVSRDAGRAALEVGSSSGLPVSLSSDDPFVATILGQDLLIHRLGTARITASQQGDKNHEAADPVSITVRVADEEEGPVKVSKVISSNGDGINDGLILEGIIDYPENRLRILSRNGLLLFDLEGYDNETKVFKGVSNTRFSTDTLPEGTYFYILEFREENKWRTKKGWFVLKTKY